MAVKEKEPPPAAVEAEAEAEAVSVLRDLVKLDTKVSENIHKLFEPIIPRATLKLLEISGDGRLWFPLTISLLLSPISLHSPTLYSFTLSLLLGLVSDIIFIGTLKHLVHRRRPLYNPAMGATLPVDHWSFPSGHASRVFFIAFLFSLSVDPLALGIDHLRFRDPSLVDRWIGSGNSSQVVALLCLLLWIWSMLTSFSRVLLGRHFVFDVFAGAFVGLFNALFVFHFLRF